MFDSVDVGALPTTGDLYAGYLDGRNTAGNAYRVARRFPHFRVVAITVTGGTLLAQVGDVETGDLTPTSGARWSVRKLTARQHPTLYCNTSTWPEVRAAVAAAGIRPGWVSYWVAADDNVRAIPLGAVAKQYQLSPGNSPGHYDVSVVADYWPGVDPPPAPPTRPTRSIVEEEPAVLYRIQGTDPVWVTNYVERRWVQDPAELAQISHDTGRAPIVLPPGSKFLDPIPVVGARP